MMHVGCVTSSDACCAYLRILSACSIPYALSSSLLESCLLRARCGSATGLLMGFYSQTFFSLSPTPPPTLGSTRICGSSPCTMLAGPSVNQHPSRLTLRGAAARCRVYVRHAGASFVEEAFWACVDARLAFVMRPAETLGGPPHCQLSCGITINKLGFVRRCYLRWRVCTLRPPRFSRCQVPPGFARRRDGVPTAGKGGCPCDGPEPEARGFFFNCCHCAQAA